MPAYLNEGARAHPFQKDPYLPAAVEERFDRLKSQIESLRKEVHSLLNIIRTRAESPMKLDDLIFGCRQLGRSYALSNATRAMRTELESLLSMFSDNAHYLRKVSGAYPINLRLTPFYFEYLASRCSDFEDKLDEFRRTYRAASLKELVPISMDPNRTVERFEIDNLSRYIDGLSGEMGNDLDKLASAFREFNTHGIPSMQYEEQREADVLISISTVGALLAAVTATTLQISLGLSNSNSLLTSIVNSFWFSSLVFSIGAALNSFLSVIWKRTPYGSRGRRLPSWLTLWIQISAPLFLAISIGTFSAGLVIFTFANDSLPSYTRYITLATTAVTSFGSIIIIAWFAYERWKSSILSDALWKPFPGKTSNQLRSWANTNSMLPVASSAAHSVKASWMKIPRSVPVTLSVVPPQTQAQDSPDDVEEQEKSLPRMARAAGVINVLRKLRPGRRPAPSPSFAPQNITVTTPYISPLRMVFPERPSKVLRQRRAVQDIEYSPNAELLATTSYDEKTKSSTTVIYTLESDYSQAEYIHQRHQVKQLSWSPASDKLLVRLGRVIDILDKVNASVCLIRIASHTKLVELQVGLKNSEASQNSVCSMVPHHIIEMNTDGRELALHNFDTLLLRDVAVVPNNPLLLITGRVTQPSKEFMPINSRGEKRLILYNIGTKQVIRRVPFLDDIRYLRISRFPLSDGLDVLLSLKDQPSSMLWSLKLQPELSLESVQTRAKTSQSVPELTGHAYFVGNQDQMIACRGTDGDIHLWDRASGLLVRRIDARTSEQGLRSFAWRPTSTSVTFASTHSKEVRIWTTELRNVEEVKEGSSDNEGAEALV
ncbi:hypothetical protein H0H92_015070 [Tricholoma furcatifolium]|nr:hypothetical protein H0H92_015070 [Tricholoma furcatifolium]